MISLLFCLIFVTNTQETQITFDSTSGFHLYPTKTAIKFKCNFKSHINCCNKKFSVSGWGSRHMVYQLSRALHFFDSSRAQGYNGATENYFLPLHLDSGLNFVNLRDFTDSSSYFEIRASLGSNGSYVGYIRSMFPRVWLKLAENFDSNLIISSLRKFNIGSLGNDNVSWSHGTARFESHGVGSQDLSGSHQATDKNASDHELIHNTFVKSQCKPVGDLKMPYMLPKEDLNLSFDQWPKNCFLRIRLTSYYKQLLKIAVDNIKLGINEHSNLQIGNAKAIPMRKKRWCYLSSPHVDKRSKDLIEIQEHVRIYDIFPCEADKEKGDRGNFKGLLMVPLPSLVSFDYWFEEIHKPVKNREIRELFNRKIWVSKYFLHHRDKEEKRHIIEQLASPELVDEIPFRWKRHKCDYYALQLGELRKILDFVKRRKAEDDARRLYNISTPKFYDIDEVRFIANKEDSKFGEELSDEENDGSTDTEEL